MPQPTQPSSDDVLDQVAAHLAEHPGALTFSFKSNAVGTVTYPDGTAPQQEN